MRRWSGLDGTRQWAGTDGTKEEATEEGIHRLQHSMEEYGKEKERRSILGDRLGCSERICRFKKGESCKGPRLGNPEQIEEGEGGSASGQRMTVFQRGNWLGARRKDGGEPY